jgi:hypothetical protein
MRMRVLSALVALAVVVAVTVTVLVVSMSRHGRSESAPGVVTVDVARLHAGDVLTTRFAVQAKGYPVIVVDAPHQGVIALVSRNTARGCRVIWVHAPGYERGIVPQARRWDEQHPQVAFVDPCRGGLYALNGDCLGGCPRGLDHLATTVVGSELRVDLRDLRPGKKRLPTAQLRIF